MWGKRVLVLLLALVGVGLLAREYKISLGVWEQNRFNLVAVDRESGRVDFVTYDPIEQKTVLIEFPSNLTINSRSVGEYSVGSLYKLGAYEGKGGEFSRRKVQGFMRMPIQGYAVGTGKVSGILWQGIWRGRERESNLSRLDCLYLWMVTGKHSVQMMGEDELIRAGVIDKNENNAAIYRYSPERLEQYLGERFFDWKVGQEGATVAVINNSGIDGMATDMAQFLTNMGLDVVAVRSGSEIVDKTQIWTNPASNKQEAITGIRRVFDFGEPVPHEKTTEYRADIVIEVGKDALTLF